MRGGEKKKESSGNEYNVHRSKVELDMLALDRKYARNCMFLVFLGVVRGT